MMDGLGQIGPTFLHCFTFTINQTKVYTFLVIASIFTNLFGHVTENNSNGRQTVNAVFRQSCQIKNIRQAAIRILASNLLRPRLIIHLVTTLPGPGIGRNGNLGSVAKRFCLICSPSSANFKTMFGGGTWEGGSCEEKNADSAGNRGSPLNGCLGEEGRADEKASPHHPCLSPSR